MYFWSSFVAVDSVSSDFFTHEICSDQVMIVVPQNCSEDRYDGYMDHVVGGDGV